MPSIFTATSSLPMSAFTGVGSTLDVPPSSATQSSASNNLSPEILAGLAASPAYNRANRNTGGPNCSECGRVRKDYRAHPAAAARPTVRPARPIFDDPLFAQLDPEVARRFAANMAAASSAEDETGRRRGVMGSQLRKQSERNQRFPSVAAVSAATAISAVSTTPVISAVPAVPAVPEEEEEEEGIQHQAVANATAAAAAKDVSRTKASRIWAKVRKVAKKAGKALRVGVRAKKAAVEASPASAPSPTLPVLPPASGSFSVLPPSGSDVPAAGTKLPAAAATTTTTATTATSSADAGLTAATSPPSTGESSSAGTITTRHLTQTAAAAAADDTLPPRSSLLRPPTTPLTVVPSSTAAHSGQHGAGKSSSSFSRLSKRVRGMGKYHAKFSGLLGPGTSRRTGSG